MTDLRPYLVGRCEAFETFASQLAQVARSDATVLLRGESGTGKSSGARAIHAIGSRAACPLVEVSLAALTPSLIEAELFGHEAGAFTGADRARVGRFRNAQGGTLVLDGIENLPLAAQVKLLRVIQERVIEPVGSSDALSIDVRLIATTQRDLQDEVRSGRFRADLYWRLAVVPITVPPLRARLEDLELLCAFLIDRILGAQRLERRDLAVEALERLRLHAWPGNVRELENALERVLVLAPSLGATSIAAAELEFLDEAKSNVATELAQEALSRGVTLEELEKAMLELALSEQRGNVSAAARRIGLTRRALEYRLAQKRSNRKDGEA